MLVYIAYKYKSIQDKKELINDLEKIADAIKSIDHNTFILGRDVHKWHSSAGSVILTVPFIIYNILKSDLIFAYFNSDVKSWGLPFELSLSRIFKKPVIFAIKSGLQNTYNNILPKQIIEFDNIEDLVVKIKELII